MFYRGELANFYPPDFLAFLASTDQDGILLVNKNDPLTIAIKDREIIDAHGNRADTTLLRTLLHKGIINRGQLQQIITAKNETHLSCREILRSLNFFPIKTIEPEIIMAMEETIFHFFLRRTGSFKFSDTLVNNNEVPTALAIDNLIIDQLSRVDAWEEMNNRLGDLQQLVQLSATGIQAKPANQALETILQMVSGTSSIAQLVAQAPLPDFLALKAISQGHDKGWLTLSCSLSQAGPSLRTIKPSLFLDFKKYFRLILRSDTLRQQAEGLLHFCKKHFDQTMMLAIKNGELKRCLLFKKNAENGLLSQDLPCPSLAIDSDQIFKTCYQQGKAFLGQLYDHSLFASITSLPKKGECAIIPLSLNRHGGRFLFTIRQHKGKSISPLHYLELLSWLIDDQEEQELPEDTGLDQMTRIVNLTEELPPMPQVAHQALEIIADPESSLEKLAEVLNEDPSLLAMIIKVSNSALYSSGQTISTIQGAVTKLGLSIIHSLVLTAATRTLFPEGDENMRHLSTQLWLHSQGCGLAARVIATTCHYPAPEEAFVGGLLHDIGRLAILLHFPTKYAAISSQLGLDEENLLTAEQQILGFDHTLIGQMLAAKWHLPAGLQACIEQHHAPLEASSNYRQLTCIVALADHLSQAASQPETMPISPTITKILTKLAIDAAGLQNIIEKSAQQFKHLRDLNN